MLVPYRLLQPEPFCVKQCADTKQNDAHRLKACILSRKKGNRLIKQAARGGQNEIFCLENGFQTIACSVSGVLF